jgi:hypothetical protein
MIFKMYLYGEMSKVSDILYEDKFEFVALRILFQSKHDLKLPSYYFSWNKFKCNQESTLWLTTLRTWTRVKFSISSQIEKLLLRQELN